MDLSILIVNYKTRDLTLACIESVITSNTSYKYEIILIDNASNDGTIQTVTEKFPQVICQANSENVGFSKANNQGILLSQGRYVLLLNSDTIVQSDTFETMLRFMDENPAVGVSGCKIVLPDGSLDKACKRGFPTPSASFYYAFGFSKLFPKTPRFNQYQLGYLSADEAYPIDSLVGAFMLIRREAIDQVGMLDEAFFMYGEDIDWCYRIKQAGWINYYYPRTHIVHYKGASSRRKPFKIIYEFHRAMILFHNKHYRQKYSWVTNMLVYAGVSVKFLLSLAKNKLRPAR
ncbi:glycosyltransferase family 2 protein [Paenibacillus sp. N3.4]|uniref:glycosyltransferase family 2 protein n=1 Tax=Paenibacillus sp. N3.4 TaxID=2603222 RepID=UPI0011C86F78|nr:glycosyltransferase family 2 protein [Paenibacillus sp. N3.4]TXK76901.1 glycosyltransferase family 2 protein [Paenibacillus sp. N3.4]